MSTAWTSANQEGEPSNKDPTVAVRCTFELLSPAISSCMASSTASYSVISGLPSFDPWGMYRHDQRHNNGSNRSLFGTANKGPAFSNDCANHDGLLEVLGTNNGMVDRLGSRMARYKHQTVKNKHVTTATRSSGLLKHFRRNGDRNSVSSVCGSGISTVRLPGDRVGKSGAGERVRCFIQSEISKGPKGSLYRIRTPTADVASTRSFGSRR